MTEEEILQKIIAERIMKNWDAYFCQRVEPEKQKEALITIASFAIAAYETFSKNEQHSETMEIIDDILKERIWQDEHWTGRFKDTYTLADWIMCICHHIGVAGSKSSGEKAVRTELVKAAAFCVAAIEAFDRNGSFPNRYINWGENETKS